MENRDKMSAKASKELLFLMEQMCREKGISKDVVFDAIGSALLSAAKKKYADSEVDIRIDKTKCILDIFLIKTAASKVSDPALEISISDAREINPTAAVGDKVEISLNIQEFGRIAAQTAKQVIFQRVREAERDVVFNEYKDKVGQIVSGTVMRREKNTYFVNIGKAEAALNVRDTLPGESLKRGDGVKGMIEEIDVTTKGPVISISRTNPDFVAALFKMEVPEISEGLVIIKDIVREPGERTKVAVLSKDTSVDPVGACVGMKGTRVQSIVRELRGERIDIIPWTDDPRMLIARALSPAVIDKVGINEEEKSAMVVVTDQQLSIAIGKRGQNVRLAMKLTGWNIDIMTDSEYSQIKMEEADRAFEEATGAAPEKPEPEKPEAE